MFTIVLLLAACQAPTALPALTEVTLVETAAPTSPPASEEPAPPSRPTPTSAPTPPADPAPPGENLPGESAPVHYLPAPVCCLAADPFDLRVVYALLANERLYISPDLGQTWQPLPLPREAVTAFEGPTGTVGQPQIYVSPYRPGLLFVRSRGSLYRSRDRGQAWQAVARQVGAWTVREHSDLLDLYAWRTGPYPDEHGLFRSKDGGESWEQMYAASFPPAWQTGDADRSLEGIFSLALDPGWEEFIYAGTNQGLYRSRNGGRNWEPFDTGLPDLGDHLRRAPQLLAGPVSGLYALTEGPAEGGRNEFLLARLAHGAVVPDQDSWEVIAHGDLAGRKTLQEAGFYGVFALEIDPLDGQVLYLATADGLLASRDGGAHFEPLGAAQARRPVYRVEAAPGVPTRLYLSTAQGFVSQLVEWPVAMKAPVESPRLQFTPQVEFEVRERIGGELTAYAVDQTAGLDATMAYLGIGSRLVLIDVSQESAPDVVSSVDLEGELAISIAVSPGQVYALTGERTLRQIDVTDRANPRQAAKVNLPNRARSLALHRETLIVSEENCSPLDCSGGLRLFSTAPGLRELVLLPTLSLVERVEFIGEYAYAFEQDCREWACTAGLRVVDLSAQPLPRLVAYLDLPEKVVAVAMEGDHLYVAHRRGLLALDVSDPARPRETNSMDLEALSSQEIDGMAVSQGYAYLIGGWSGIQIYSLQDPDRPRRLKSWQPQGGYFPAHLLAHDQALYLIDTFGEFGYCSSGLTVIDLSDPGDPRLAPGADYKYVCADRPTLAGERLYLTDWDGLHVLDLADPLHPRSFSDYTVDGPVEGLVADQLRLFWSNSRASKSLYGVDVSDPEHARMTRLASTWTGGMALDWNYLYVPAWADGLRVLDVFTYYAPVTLATLSREDLAGEAYRAVLDGRYLYVTLGGLGLRILDVADPSRPRRLGLFETDAYFEEVVVQGDTAYLLSFAFDDEARQGEVLVLDVENRANPRQVRAVGLPAGERATALAARGSRLYLGSQACPSEALDGGDCPGRLYVYNLANPERPALPGQLDLPGTVIDIIPAEEYLYLAAGPAG
ncbi:MAG TPA: hypothetical protein VI776_14870, partial [Anaerolineales bacterium]|nr:hypothetical protein [Anaerolineales bacterium]